MNPFGATVGPDYGAPPAPAPAGAYGPPPGGYPPPPPAAYAPPGYAPQPAAPPQPAPAYGAPAQPQWAPPAPQPIAAPPAVPPVAMPPRASSPNSGAHSHDPSAFAATSPPPTTDEHEAQIRRSQAPVGQNPSAPPVAAVPPPMPLGPGRDPELVEQGAIRALAGFLVSFDSSDLGMFWPIYQGQNVIGRKGAGAGLDIEIDSPTTSSRHAVVYASARPGRLKVEDTGSTNGTFQNEAPLERSKKVELRDNDVLRLGGFNVTVKII